MRTAEGRLLRRLGPRALLAGALLAAGCTSAPPGSAATPSAGEPPVTRPGGPQAEPSDGALREEARDDAGTPATGRAGNDATGAGELGKARQLSAGGEGGSGLRRDGGPGAADEAAGLSRVAHPQGDQASCTHLTPNGPEHPYDLVPCEHR